jgi:hypothetical protein
MAESDGSGDSTNDRSYFAHTVRRLDVSIMFFFAVRTRPAAFMVHRAFALSLTHGRIVYSFIHLGASLGTSSLT